MSLSNNSLDKVDNLTKKMNMKIFHTLNELVDPAQQQKKMNIKKEITAIY